MAWAIIKFDLEIVLLGQGQKCLCRALFNIIYLSSKFQVLTFKAVEVTVLAFIFNMTLRLYNSVKVKHFHAMHLSSNFIYLSSKFQVLTFKNVEDKAAWNLDEKKKKIDKNNMSPLKGIHNKHLPLELWLQTIGYI